MTGKTETKADKPKPIQVIPSADVYRKITTLAEQLRTSRGGVCAIGLDFILPKLESGELLYINGKLVPANKREAAAAA